MIFSHRIHTQVTLPVTQKKYITPYEINCSNNLRNLSLLQQLGHSLVEVEALLGVRKVFELDDFELPTLFDESEDAETVVLELSTIRGSTEGRPLRRSYGLMYQTAWKIYVHGRTWITTFPGASITSWKAY